MKKVHNGYILLIVFLFGVTSEAPSYGLRCGTALVSIGDSTSEVIAKCGEPEEVEVFRGVLETIEKWTYNFGATRLIRYLRFVNDRLKGVTTGGYGG